MRQITVSALEISDFNTDVTEVQVIAVCRVVLVYEVIVMNSQMHSCRLLDWTAMQDRGRVCEACSILRVFSKSDASGPTFTNPATD